MAVLTCEEGQVYVAVTKKCKSYGSEESYQILSGSTTLITSQPFASNEQRTDEYCLAAANNNNQYTFRMKDTYGSSGDSWTAGAWVSVAGIYGNIFFKNFMTERVTEDVALSLYYPIMKGETWRMLSSSSSIASDWTAVAFADASWQEVSSNTTTVSGSQYFRKHFASIANMAAYELQLNYRYGIVAYVNGVEVFRDHMPEGAMTPATLSDGAFDAYGFYGTIRPAGEIEGADSVLAVELHFPEEGEHAVEFDAYLALLASSTPSTESTACFIYPYAVTLTATTGTGPAKIFDYDKTGYYSASSSALPATVSYELGGPRAYVNGLRVWPYSYYSSAPGSFTWQGAMRSTEAYTTVIGVSDATYQSSVYRVFSGYFNAKAFSSYRLVVSSSASHGNVQAVEVQPVVCHDLLPTAMTFDPASYAIYANYEEVTIHPTLIEFTGCTVQPALPAGLTLDAATCTVTGKATAALPSTAFTMTSAMGTHSFQGTFTLEVTDCAGHAGDGAAHLQGQRATTESFTIKEHVASQQVVLDVAANSGQPTSQDWTRRAVPDRLPATKSLRWAPPATTGRATPSCTCSAMLTQQRVRDDRASALRLQPRPQRRPHRQRAVGRGAHARLAVQDERGARQLADGVGLADGLHGLLPCLQQPDPAVQADLQCGVSEQRGWLCDLASLPVWLHRVHERR